MAKSERSKYWLFASQYLSQGISEGFVFFGILVGLLTSQTAGVGAEGRGVFMAIIMLPWVAKPLWGLMADIFRGREKGILAACLVGMGAALAALALAQSYWPLLIGVGVHSILRSMQDVVTDGLAVRHLRKEERSAGQGFMWAARAIGIAIGGSGGLQLKSAGFSWWSLCTTAGCLVVAVGLVGVRLGWRTATEKIQEPAEPPRKRDRALSRAAWIAGLFTLAAGVSTLLPRVWPDAKWTFRAGGLAVLAGSLFFSRRAGLPLAALLVALVANLGAQSFAESWAPKWLAGLGWREGVEFAILAVASQVAVAVGALTAGFVGQRRPPKFFLAFAAGVSAAAYAALPLVVSAGFGYYVVWLAVLATCFADGLYGTSLFAVMMPFARGKTAAATQFAVIMAALNMSAVVGKLAGGVSAGDSAADVMDFPALFAGAVILQLVVLLPLRWLRLPKEAGDNSARASPAVTSDAK